MSVVSAFFKLIHPCFSIINCGTAIFNAGSKNELSKHILIDTKKMPPMPELERGPHVRFQLYVLTL